MLILLMNRRIIIKVYYIRLNRVYNRFYSSRKLKIALYNVASVVINKFVVIVNLLYKHLSIFNNL